MFTPSLPFPEEILSPTHHPDTYSCTVIAQGYLNGAEKLAEKLEQGCTLTQASCCCEFCVQGNSPWQADELNYDVLNNLCYKNDLKETGQS